jgi:hypothetical protein
VLRAEHQLARNNAFLENPPVLIDILEKKVECCQTLNQSALDGLPLPRRDDAGKQVVGKDPLRSLIVSINRKRDALMKERAVGVLLAPAQFSRRQLEQPPTPGRSNISS